MALALVLAMDELGGGYDFIGYKIDLQQKRNGRV